MNLWLGAAYPLLLCIWVAAHFVTNELASRRHRSIYSTRIILDETIPFVPGMAVLYFSGFILGNMAYFLLGFTECFTHIAIGYGIQFAVSISLYVIYPCRTNRCEDFIPVSTSGYFLAAFQRISKPFNGFPSMHVSYGLFSALSVWGCGSQSVGLVMIVWAVSVALSTLLIKQHHIIDVLVGAALGAGVYLLLAR